MSDDDADGDGDDDDDDDDDGNDDGGDDVGVGNDHGCGSTAQSWPYFLRYEHPDVPDPHFAKFAWRVRCVQCLLSCKLWRSITNWFRFIIKRINS